ncbi:hypothetical protein CJ030_MR7G014297 [Morella rubra]|uniref:Uncharacterized protein n=1 Tax=Morella rubra TaxID=262757 RepID=A0A6A1V0H0_9ROSI|nr:hypothetical protein CJ030_MR7G014297 [Morella rubra]
MNVKDMVTAHRQQIVNQGGSGNQKKKISGFNHTSYNKERPENGTTSRTERGASEVAIYAPQHTSRKDPNGNPERS